MPSTNNGLESTNGTIKTGKTLRERLPMNVYLGKVLELLRMWSLKRKPTSVNYVPYAISPKILNDQWSKAYHLAIDKNFKITSNQKEVILN